MKHIAFLSLLLSLNTFIYSQSLEETIIYINEKAKKYTADDGTNNEKERNWAAIVIFDKELSQPMKLYKYYDHFILDSKGIITIERRREIWEIPAGTKYPDWLTYQPKKIKTETVNSHNTYLKQLESTVESSVKNHHFKNNIVHIISIYCKDTKRCFISSEGNSFDNEIRLSNSEEARKVKNAIEHLIKKGQQTDNFKEKDPFDY